MFCRECAGSHSAEGFDDALVRARAAPRSPVGWRVERRGRRVRGDRGANTALVRELNGLTRDGFQRLSDQILEHEAALDSLVSETLGHYGIQAELLGDSDAPADSAPLVPAAL